MYSEDYKSSAQYQHPQLHGQKYHHQGDCSKKSHNDTKILVVTFSFWPMLMRPAAAVTVFIHHRSPRMIMSVDDII